MAVETLEHDLNILWASDGMTCIGARCTCGKELLLDYPVPNWVKASEKVKNRAHAELALKHQT